MTSDTADTLAQATPTAVQAASGWQCAIVGDELLAVQCAQAVLAHGLGVAVVATVHPHIQAWAAGQGIACVRSDQRLAQVLAAHSFDVLLSIANLRVLPPEVLSQAKVAINFHDGPLPAYAGLNVTSWALLAGETGHAVTWHLMTRQVDAGDVLATEPLPILPDDTSFSLNARCFEAGVRSFDRVVKALAAGQLVTRPQPTGERQVFRRWQRPVSLFDPNQPAHHTDRLVRALNLGGRQFQQLGAVKLWLHGDMALLTQARCDTAATLPPPGTVRSMDADGICLATCAGWLWLQAATQVCGTPIDVVQWAASRGVQVGGLWPSPPDALTHALADADPQLAAQEPAWLERLAHLEPPDLPLLRPDDAASASVTSPALAAVPAGAPAQPAPGQPAEWGSLFLSLGDTALASPVTEAELGAAWATWQWRTGASGDATWVHLTQACHKTTPALRPLLHAPFERLPVVADEPWSKLVKRAAHSAAQPAAAQPWLRDLVSRDPRTRGHWPPLHLAIAKDRAPAELASQLHHLAPQVCLCLVAASPTTPNSACRLIWRKHCLPAAVAQRIAGQLSQLLKTARAQPNRAWAQLDILTDADTAVMHQLNQTAKAYDATVTLDRLMAVQALLHPQAPALSFGPVTLTHSQLVHEAAQLAQRLRDTGIQRGNRVGLGVSRGLPMVIGMLAIWQCGAAHVPLDTTYPADRLNFMIGDAALKAVLVDPGSDLGQSRPGLVVCELAAPGALSGSQPTQLLAADHTADDLAYVMYTSGSTGKPKGVMVTHRNVVNFLVAMDDVLRPPTPVTWLSVTSLSFDISVLELVWTLSRGHHVVLKADRGVPLPAGSPPKRVLAAPSNPANVACGTATQRPVSLSLFYFAAGEAPAADGYRLLMEGAKFADANGFEAIWTPERHFHAFGGLYPNPSVVGAAVAVLTQNVHIRGGSVLLPLHSPIRVAEEWAVVDNLSGGRTGIAVAAGWQPNDFVLNPTAYTLARDKLADGIDSVRKLWRGDALMLEGPHGHPVPVRTLPRPVQRELPVWLTTAGNPASFVQAGQLGLHVLTHLLGQSVDGLARNLQAYRNAWAAAGHPGQGRVTLMLHTYLARDSQTARDVARPALKGYLRTAAGLIQDMASAFPTFARAGKDADEAFKSLTDDESSQLLDVATSRYLDTSGLFGTPTEAADMIDAVSAIGVDEVACLIDYGVATDAVIDSFDLLLETKQIIESRRAVEHENTTNLPAWDDRTAALVARHKVSHLQCTPSMAAMLLADPADRQSLSQLQHMLVGGETLPSALCAALRGVLPGRLTNLYGPTETTIWSLSHDISQPPRGTVPIGKPLANTQVCVLDARGQPVPAGVWGELHIGGDGVALGYHGRPELTAQRFVDRPGLGRLYATGDVVRIHPDGWLAFAGRSDHQIKLHGHRIELGEIEAVLNTHPQVAQSVVVAREDSHGPELVAYVVLRAGSHVDAQALRQHVSRNVIPAMVPAQVVVLASLPLTPNGKVDRKALPAPQGAAASVQAGAAGSHDAAGRADAARIEATVSAVWADALGKPAGLNDNFFEVGGHSLMAIVVFRKLSEQLPVKLALTDIFRFPTIRALAAHVLAVWPQPASPPGSPHADAPGVKAGAPRRRNKGFH